MKFVGSVWYGLLLNFLFPGLGHIYFREYLFGVFILLVWLIATVLFYISYLVELPTMAKIVLFGLPLLFYLFTFLDLSKSIANKQKLKSRGAAFAGFVLFAALIYQIFSPTAPANFWIHNGPRIFALENNRLSPLYQQNSLMKVSSLDYRINIAGFDRPFLHHLPQRYDIVRCRLPSGQIVNAVVLGLPGEGIEVIEGTVIIDGTPEFGGWIGGLTFTGKVPYTGVGEFSILAAELSLGTIDKVYQVSLSEVQGKVEKLFN